MSDFRKIEEILLAVSRKLKFLDESDFQNEAKEFIDHREYGLAWETLVALVNKHIDRAPDAVLADLVKIGRSMGIDVQIAYSN